MRSILSETVFRDFTRHNMLGHEWIDMESELTEDQMRLLFVIDEYTKTGNEANPVWVKELPILAIIYEGIIRGVFKDYDYAPWSVHMLDGTRQWMNVSREGKDDVEDLLNLRLVSILRISTSQYGYVTAYRPTELGDKLIQDIPQKLRDDVHSLILCKKCGTLFQIITRGHEVFFHCKGCGHEQKIGIDDIEDVPYATRPYLPNFNFRWFMSGEKEDD